MESYIARISQFERHLDPSDGETINLQEFKDLCFGGIPDKPGLRQICWKILLHYLPLDKTRWDSVLLEQRRLYYSFVKDLIVEPELGEADFIKDEREDSDWSLFLQDNKTLEQIDKDVRRTLPDFAFFQLPIPYSPFCPLSIDPRTREPKKKHKSAKKTDVTDTATPTATVSLTAMDDKTIATHNKSDDCVVSTLARPLEFSSLLKTQTPPNSLPNFPSDSISMLSKSFPKSGLNSWINVASGGTHTHYGFQTPPITGTMPSTLKRRQTVTVMSPRAERKLERLDTPANERDSWASNSNPTTTTTIDNGFETPPLSNGFRMPNNDTVDFNDIGVAYSSPVPSKLKDVKSLLTESEDKSSTPVLPDYLFSPIPTRRSLFKRVAHLNQDFGSREHQPHTVQASRSQENWMKKRQDMLDHSRKTAKEAAAAAAMPMAMTTSPIDVPLSSSPDSIAGNSQSNRKAKQDPELDGCDHERDNEDMKEDDEDELPQDLHWEAIERILFIYAKLNPGVGYVQGMNEILGPLYYLLANDPDEVSRAHAEAESFWLFHLLMAHFRDHFVRSLDRDRVSGIGSSIARMNLRLKQFDEELWQDLEEKGIAPEYYSFRWLTVLCTQEFEVPDVWRIWDSVLADTGGVEKDYDFLLDLGCAMVCHLRSELLTGDFADNVKLLQNYPPVDIQPILQLATVIRDQRVNESFHFVVSGPKSQESGYYGQYNHHNHSLQQSSSRRSMDFRIWTSSSNNNSNGGQGNATSDAASDSCCYIDAKIDGVQSSDRLDRNLEGIDHRVNYTPQSATFKKDKPPSISGLSLDSLWTRSQSNQNSGAMPTTTGDRGVSPSGLSMNNFTVRENGNSRSQIGSWTETFNLFRAKLVRTPSSLTPSPILPLSDTMDSSNNSSAMMQGSHGSIGTLIPPAEL